MAYSRWKYFDTVWNSSLVHTQKGFAITNLTDLFSLGDNISYKISLNHQYRPDLIAAHFYQNPKLFFVLIYANNFRYGIQDFTVNTVIKVPRYERIVSIL